MNWIESDGRPEALPAACARGVSGIAAIGALASLTLTSGCAVVSVASTAASLAATAASTAIDVGVGAVRVTGKVIGKGVDLVTGSPPRPPTPSLSSDPSRR